MQYLILIYSTESKDQPKPEDMAEFVRPWMEYGAALKEAGVWLGGEALQPVATATTISSIGADEPVFTDGPFAETKEQLGGFYLLDCKDLDEALAWGAKCPGVQFGKIEVRPIQKFD